MKIKVVISCSSLLFLIVIAAFIGSSLGKEDVLEEVSDASEEFEASDEPKWGEVTYGNLDTYKTVVTDVNGVESVQIGEAPPMVDMLANSLIGQETEEEETVTQKEEISSNAEAKARYLESLQSAYDLSEEASSADSYTQGILAAYEAWDNELNKIYGLLKEKLSAEKMAALKKDELDWIKFRKVQAGDPDVVGAITTRETRLDLTTKRTLYLIDMYFDEPSSMKYVQLADETGNIREKPSIDSKIVFNGRMGDMFTYLQKKVNTADGRTWYKVEYSSGLVGYISHAVSNLTNEIPPYVRLMEDDTKIRSAPSLEADSINEGNFKDQIVDYSNDRTYASDGRIWLRVKYASEYGYVSQKVATMTRFTGFGEF